MRSSACTVISVLRPAIAIPVIIFRAAVPIAPNRRFKPVQIIIGIRPVAIDEIVGGADVPIGSEAGDVERIDRVHSKRVIGPAGET